jgi:hypothetical protein
MSRTVDGTFGLTKNQPPTVTRPFDFGTDAIERQRVSLGQSIIDADFEYGLQATKWQTYQEIRKTPSFYEIPGTDITVTNITSNGANPSIITVTVSTTITLAVGQIISIVGLSNQQRNADRAEGFFIIKSNTGGPTTSFTYEARGVVGTASQVIFTSYTVLRRGGIYTNSTAYLPYTNISTDGATNSVMTVAFPPGQSHGLVPGTPIQTTMDTFTGFENASGSFVITSVPSANTFTFTTVGQVTGSTQTNSANRRIYTSPYAYVVHRPFDGGVLLSPGQPSHGASCLRQSKKVFRYQSGKGLLWSSGTLFCPNNDITSANVVGNSIVIVTEIPHGIPQPGATIRVRGIKTPGYNGLYTITTIRESRTIEVIPPVVPTITPAELDDQPRFTINSWSGSSVRAGCFEDQNGLFWEWDGQTLWAVKRSSTFQTAGYVTVSNASQVIVGDTTDKSVYADSVMRFNISVPAVTAVNGSYSSITSSTSIPVTVSAKTGVLNPGLQIPITAFSGMTPGTGTVITSASYAAITSGATTVAITNAVYDGPIVPDFNASYASNMTFLNGYPGFISACQVPSSFTFTFSTAVPTNVVPTSIIGNGSVATVTRAAHNLTTGTSVTIAGAVPTGFRVTAVITVISSSQFTFESTVNASATTVGTYTFTIPAGTMNSVIAATPASDVTNSATSGTYAAITNQTQLQIFTPNIMPVVGASIPLSAFGAYGGYAYVSNVNTGIYNYNFTVTFSQPQTIVPRIATAAADSSAVTVAAGAGTYIAGTAQTVNITGITGATGTFALGQYVAAAVIGGSTRPGVITLVTSQTNITLTFPNSFTTAGGTLATATFFTPRAGSVITSAGTYAIGTPVTSVAITSITKISGTFVIGQYVAAGIIGGSTAQGVITTVTDQTSITVTYPAAFTPTGGVLGGAIFYTLPLFTTAINWNTSLTDAGAVTNGLERAVGILSPLTSNNSTATTGSFVVDFVVPQTVAAGTFTSQTLSTRPTLQSRIMPFVADPIPIGTSNIMIVTDSPNNLLYPNMQTAAAAFTNSFGSNAYVSYTSGTTSNAFVLNFPPLSVPVEKSAVTGLNNVTFNYPNTRFIDQLKVNDKVVIRGMTHTVVQLQTQGCMIVNPPFRGTTITVPVKMCKVKEIRTPQSQFNRDTLDGNGPSGYNFDPTRMQMTGLQYTWYGAGFVDFMMRGGDGNWVYAHRYKQNNINDEAYMRTGNMPVRYEIVNETIACASTLAQPVGLLDNTLTLTDNTTYWPNSGNVLVDNELVNYTGKSGNTLTGVTRAGVSNFNGSYTPTWVAQTNFADAQATYSAWSPELGLFAAVNTNNAYYSRDGKIWTAAGTPTGAWVAIAWSPQLRVFVAVGSAVQMWSSDGITWNTGSTLAGAWVSVAWSPGLCMFVAVGSAVQAYSRDGKVWTSAGTTTGAWRSVDWSPKLGLFAAVGTNTTMYSINGVTWSAPVGVTGSWASIKWSPELGLFAVGSNGSGFAMWSSNGTTWNVVPGLERQEFIEWSPQLGLFTGVSPNQQYVYHSRDGKTWTKGNTLGPGYNGSKCVTWSPQLGIFLVTYDNSLIVTSVAPVSSIVYNINDSPYTLTASNVSQQHNLGSSVNLIGVTCVPSLTHWGSAFIMDGQFDTDRGYFFNYQKNAAAQLIVGGATPTNLFMLRLAPSVSNGVIGDLGTRDLLNRAQLLLQRMDVFANAATIGTGSIVVSGILNPSGVSASAWTAINSSGNGSQPSFAQVSDVTGTYTAGSGERVFSTICNGGSQNSIDISGLKEISNTIIGGNGFFPDGPDTLLVQLNVPTGFPTITNYSVNLFWTEAQA